MFLGSGGGGGGRGVNGYGGDGGRGGGIVLVFAADLATAEGAIQATGGRGGDALIAADDGRGGGGGGSGGSILLTSGNLAMGLTNVNASGGDKGTSCTGQSLGSGGAAGTGGVGRIVVKYAGSLSGESVPAASTLQQNLGTAVSFGGTHAPAVCTNATTLVATLPPHAAGTVDVQLVESGTVVATLTNGFVYREFAEPTLLAVVPNEGGLAGGQWVTLQGVGVWSVATPYGTGTDGDVVLSGAKNLNVDGLAAGRTNADAISFSVTNLTSGSATLSAVPAAGALNVGDEVMLINLQGAAGAVSNVGRHEFLRVGLVAGNVVTFVAPKSNFYGSASGSDAGIGVAAGQQRVMLQRVPNYRNLTIGSGGTLTANAWDGTRGGVLMFRVANVFSNNGAISMAGKGYRAGPAGPALVYGYVGDSLVPYGPQQLANAYGGGGGGGYGSSSGCGGGAGGGGGYGSTGANGGSGVCGVPGGTGGAVYGAANLSLMMLGSGGGSSGDYYGGGAPSAGGAGGGAIMIAARNALGFGSLTAAGATGSGAGLDGGGGGGAGGSIRLDVEDAYLMNMTLSAGGGAGGSRSYGGLGGAGGAGRIAIYSTRASSGSSSPAASFFAIDPLNEVAHVRVDGTETAFEVLDDQRIRVLMPAHAAGVVSMSVELANGASYSLPGAYTYEPPSPVVLAGRVTSKFSGVGVDGVHVAFTGLDGVTSSNGGYFSATMPSGWSGVATPMLDDKRFVPAQAAFTNLNQSVTGLLFQIVLDDDPERGDLEYYVQTLAGLGTLTNYTIQTRHASIPVEFLNVRGGTNVAANWTPGSTNQDDRMLMVRVEGDLTIGAGATVTPAARKRGLVMYVDGDLTLNGKISMTARGAANVAGDRILV
ncbi:MAG TPA: IPT/TIG domain-containing protein, partial [Kiritimatiellia bacterium]|nr:IPT/TIG domain-containing protein [Kiritimatiellia bacterium]